MRLRKNPQALWLSELGSSRAGYAGYSSSAAAGTKRVGKLVRSVKWTGELIDRSLLEKADEEVTRLKEQGNQILCVWDGSVVEKAESEKLEGLCPVLSSKAKRRQRTKRALVFNWPAARAVRVMGMQWTAALIVGRHGLPHLAVSRWWATKGVAATPLRATEEEVFRICVRKGGPRHGACVCSRLCRGVLAPGALNVACAVCHPLEQKSGGCHDFGNRTEAVANWPGEKGSRAQRDPGSLDGREDALRSVVDRRASSQFWRTPVSGESTG